MHRSALASLMLPLTALIGADAGVARSVAAPEPRAAAAATARLPQVRLQVRAAIRDDPKVGAQLTVTGDGRDGDYRGRAGIELRGQSSQRFPRSPTASSCPTATDRIAGRGCSGCRRTTTGSSTPPTTTRR